MRESLWIVYGLWNYDIFQTSLNSSWKTNFNTKYIKKTSPFVIILNWIFISFRLTMRDKWKIVFLFKFPLPSFPVEWKTEIFNVQEHVFHLEVSFIFSGKWVECTVGKNWVILLESFNRGVHKYCKQKTGRGQWFSYVYPFLFLVLLLNKECVRKNCDIKKGHFGEFSKKFA